MVKLKCYYKPVGAFFERPPVFVNDPYEHENGLHAILRYTDSIFVGVDALGDPIYRTPFVILSVSIFWGR